MPIVAVVPVKSFRHGKQRLAGSLPGPTHLKLGQALAGHVAACAEEAGLLPLVVTGDPEVAEWAMMTGFPTLTDPGEGLSRAAAAGVAWAGKSGSSWVVIHSDLPLLNVDDLAAVADCLQATSWVIAPSADGGTSVLGGAEAIEFAYGVGSFHRHLARLSDPCVLARVGLLLDIDSDNDLRTALAHPAGAWLAQALGDG